MLTLPQAGRREQPWGFGAQPGKTSSLGLAKETLLGRLRRRQWWRAPDRDAACLPLHDRVQVEFEEGHYLDPVDDHRVLDFMRDNSDLNDALVSSRGGLCPACWPAAGFQFLRV